jgi:hypothetical protein
MSSDYYGAQAGEIADRGAADECERCGSILVADDPNGYDGPLCGPCELGIDDEPGECQCYENRNYGTCGH